MAIITISRELAALGDETAAELVKLSGYKLLNKQGLEEQMKALGLSELSFKRYDEKKPSFFASFSQGRDDYLHYLKTAMFDGSAQGNVIIIGRGSSAILKDVPSVVSIFLTTSMDSRTERVKSYFHCDVRRARQIIEQSDNDRNGFHRYFFDMEWKDSSNYHMVLNTESLHPAACARSILAIKDVLVNKEAEDEGKARIAEMQLGNRIVHHLFYEKNLAIHFLEAGITGDQVTLYGVASSAALIDAALEAAKEVEGGTNVQSEIQVVHEYNIGQGGMMP
jgi:cytidylate kinase